MSSTTTTTTPREALPPLVVPLSPPPPVSAVERFSADMYLRGLIDVPTSNRVSQGRETAVPQRQVTPTGVDVSSSDSGDTTAYSTDTASSEDTTYSSDSVEDATDKLGGITIAAGVNEGCSITKGKRVELLLPGGIVPRNQRYLVQMSIRDQPVADMGAFKERYNRHLDGAEFGLEIDDGSNTTWLLGFNSRQLIIEPGSTTGGAHVFKLEPWDAGAANKYLLGEREVIYDHAGIHCQGRTPIPEGIMTGIAEYADKSGAAVLLHDRNVELSIKCFNWAEKSWLGSMSMDYRPAVAYAITKSYRNRPKTSGILALGPMMGQAAFNGAVSCFEAPAFLEVVQNHLPYAKEGGTVIYFAIRPTALYQATTTGYQVIQRKAEHWMSFNGWPCKLQPTWSQDICIAPNYCYWKVRLLSMTFQRYNADNKRYEPLSDPEAGTITFGGDGLLVHLDCGKSGSSVSLVPPSLVRHIRTKLWPTAKNLEIDAKEQDTPCSLDNPKVPYYVPFDDFIAVVYKFTDHSGKTIEVTGPSSHFFGQPSPQDHINTKDKEGLIFVGAPDVIGREAIFGLNFFQAMFVALYKPDSGDPFVRLAPQWESQMVQFSPRAKVDSNV